MARSITAPEQTLVNSSRWAAHIRVLIEDGAGVLREMTSLNGLDHLHSVTWRESVDDFVGSGSVTLIKRVGAQSIVPMDEDSAVNEDGVGAYSPLIRKGRQILIYAAITAVGAAGSTWYNLFHGRLDEPDWADASLVRVSFRDLGGILADASIIQDIDVPAGSLESRIQYLLDFALGAGVVTLYTPVATGKSLPPFQQKSGYLFEAIRKLAIDNGQYDLRYWWDPVTSTYRLTLWAPDLVTTTPTFLLSGNEYLHVTELKENPDGIINQVRINYNGTFVNVSDPASITDNGPRFDKFDAPTVLTALAATAYGTALLSDLAGVYADHAVENLFYPIVELRDVVGWAANTDYYSVQKNWSVVGYEHEFGAEDSAPRTTIRTRGKARLAGLNGWGSTGAIAPDFVVETPYSGENLVAQVPGFVPDRDYPHTEEIALPLSWFPRLLEPGTVVTLGGQIDSTTANDHWGLRIRVLDAAGAVLLDRVQPSVEFSVYGGVYVGAAPLSVTIPANAAEIRIGIQGFQSATGYIDLSAPVAPAGTATYRRMTFTRGATDVPYNEIEGSRSSRVRAAIAAAIETAAVTSQADQQEGFAGMPGDRISTQPLYDAAGLTAIVDTLLQRLQNAQVVRGSITIDDRVTGALQQLEDVRGSRVSDASIVGVITNIVNELMQRQGLQVGIPGNGVAAIDLYDAAGITRLLNAAALLFTNAELERSTMSIADRLNGTLQQIEDVRSGRVSDASVVGIITAIVMELMQRQGSQVGVPGKGVAAIDLYDQTGVTRVFDAIARSLNNVVRIDNGSVSLVIGPALVDDGVALRPIVKGHVRGLAKGGSVSGSTWTDGTAIVFAVAFAAAPVVILQGGVVNEMRRAKWTGPYDPMLPSRVEMEARDVSVSGFTPRARFVQVSGSLTARTDAFAGTQLDVIGETDAVELANAPAYNDGYRVAFTITLNTGYDFDPVPGPFYIPPPPAQCSIKIAIDSSSDGGSTWVERWQGEWMRVASNDDIETINWNETITVSGLTNTVPIDEIRLRVVDVYVSYGPGYARCVGTNVQYTTAATQPIYASKTPDQATDDEDRIMFTALSVS